MGIEDELRSRADAMDAAAADSARVSQQRHEDYQAALHRALERVREVAVEASALLKKEGLKPARLWSVPPKSKMRPLIGYALAANKVGYGFHVVDHVVVSTDGSLFTQNWHRNKPKDNLGATKIRVQHRTSQDEIPYGVRFNGNNLYIHSTGAYDVPSVEQDFIDLLKDGYAELLRLHRTRGKQSRI